MGGGGIDFRTDGICIIMLEQLIKLELSLGILPLRIYCFRMRNGQRRAKEEARRLS